MSNIKNLALLSIFALSGCASNAPAPQQASEIQRQFAPDCVFPLTSDPAPKWVCKAIPEEGEYQNYKLLGLGTSKYTDGVNLNFMRKEARKAALEEIATSLGAKVTSGMKEAGTRTAAGTFDNAVKNAGKFLSDPDSFPGAIRVEEITSPDKTLYILVGLRTSDLVTAAQGAAAAARSSLGNDPASYQIFSAERLLKEMEEDAQAARSTR